MFASQNQEPSIIDALGSNITEWYNAIDEGLRKSDIIPGTYEYTNHPSYGNVGQLQEGADTNLDIQLNRFCVASLDNSYITLTQEVPITAKSTTALGKIGVCEKVRKPLRIVGKSAKKLWEICSVLTYLSKIELVELQR